MVLRSSIVEAGGILPANRCGRRHLFAHSGIEIPYGIRGRIPKGDAPQRTAAQLAQPNRLGIFFTRQYSCETGTSSMWTSAQLAEAFAVDAATLRNWVRVGRFGSRDGRHRTFDGEDAFAIGLLTDLLRAGVPIGYGVIESAKIIAASRDRPPTIRVRGSEFTSIDIDLRAATSTIQQKLGALA